MKKSAHKPATFTLDNSAEARRFLTAVCDPLATQIIEQEGTLAMFDRVPDVGVYDVITASRNEEFATISEAVEGLTKNAATKDTGNRISSAAIGYGLHCLHAGYLLGLSVGQKIGGGR